MASLSATIWVYIYYRVVLGCGHKPRRLLMQCANPVEGRTKQWPAQKYNSNTVGFNFHTYMNIDYYPQYLK
jgi:hypothetical protein